MTEAIVRIIAAAGVIVFAVTGAVAETVVEREAFPPGTPAVYTERCGLPDLERSASPAARPGPLSYVIDSGNFRVFYSDPPLVAYAQRVSDAAELAWRVLIDTLGYVQPPSDAPQGGDGRIDIYILSNLGGAWGATRPELPTGTPYPNSYTSWIEIADTLSVERLEVVTAHECFHVIHLGYDRDENTSYLEMLGTWAEDRVFDDHNLYLEVLPLFFDNPDKALYGQTYSNVVWARYLSEKYGDSLLVVIMDYCGVTVGSNPRSATTLALADVGGDTFIEELKEFALWNYFTGARDDGRHYEEAATYPLVAIERRFECYPFPLVATLHKPRSQGANYFWFRGNGYTDSLRIHVVPEQFSNTVITATKFRGGTYVTDVNLSYTLIAAADSFTVGDWSDCDSMLVVYQVDSGAQASSYIALRGNFVPAPLPQSDYVLLLDRDDCARPYNGVGDQFNVGDGSEAPLVAALRLMGAPARVSNILPADLNNCRGIVLAGGYGASGPTLSDPELTQLMAYLDGGGDIYVEGRRFGEWFDPLFGQASAAAEAFWAYFGCDFVQGNPGATGNVSSWSTSSTGLFGAFSFQYDYRDEPDDYVGALALTGADTMIVDQLGTVRGSYIETGGSIRAYATVMLGGSTPDPSAREDFLASVIGSFGVTVPVMAVESMNVQVLAEGVSIEGRVSGYYGERLELIRNPGSVSIAYETQYEGDDLIITAMDEDAARIVTYLLVTEGQRLLWQQTVDRKAPALPWRLANLYPSPARSSISLVIDTDRGGEALIRFYDIRGGLVLQTRRVLDSGSNVVLVGDLGGLSSGVYFVRVSGAQRRAQRKFMILR